ncbi:hypothetical protein F2P56_008856 [Juglans regia]|uniref:KIB1-4 beta-propeller domain-containing protein n=2 Tax=Juglans regia TaxID=51240 RepID=A0A834D276_JUGRE|nr:hypothetical protein F2P56_008856 [Juglans regia]
MTALQMSSASSIGMPSQWSLLLSDLLKSIEEHTMSYADKVRLRCVCASWRSQLPKLHDHPIGTRLPWLLVPFNDNLDSKGASKFYDPLEKKLYELDHLPEAEEKALFKGSTQGGWVVVAETGDKIYVVNPLTRARFQLPPRSKFPDVRKYRANKHDNEYLIREPHDFNEYYQMDATHLRNYFLPKVVLSPSTCDSTDFIAVAIYGEIGRLAYCRRGDKKWHVLSEEFTYSDVRFHEQVLYAVEFNGRLLAFDFNTNASCPKPKEIEIVAPFPTPLTGQLYLVWCSGGIIMVRRDTDLDDEAYDQDVRISVTLGFNIFKLDSTSDDGKGKWCEVESLGDHVLFLGLNSSTAFSCRDFPGCFKGNQIYCTDDNVSADAKGSGRLFDQGVYSLDEKVFERFPAYVGDTRQVWPAPIWIMPK